MQMFSYIVSSVSVSPVFACTINVIFQNLAESGLPMISQAACLEAPKTQKFRLS